MCISLKLGRIHRLLPVWLLAFVCPLSVLATPSGLNNIPTAETIPHRNVAVQAFSSLGGPNQFAVNGPGKPSHWMGFKTGLELASFRVETGLDSHLFPGRTGSLLFQSKVGVNPWKDGQIAAGVANVALTDRDRWSDPFSYGMVAHDFGVVRAHAGYGVQTRGNTVLLGVDRTWKILERDFNLNADLVQTRNQHGWLPAIGAKYGLNKHIVFEAWTNFPDRGNVSFIGKINFIFKF